MKLSELQRKFVKSIYADDNSFIEGYLSTSYPDLSLYIYKNNLFSNLKVALENIYPSVRSLLCQDEFMEICKKYIKNNVSKDGNLDSYGFNFPDFLKAEKEGYVCDVAKLDLAAHIAYSASNYSVRNIDDFHNITKSHYENLKFVINPSVTELSLVYDVLPLWDKINSAQYNRDDYCHVVKKDSYAMIYRNLEHQICSLHLSKNAYYFIRLVVEGKSFYELFEYLDKKCLDGEFMRILNKLIVNNVIIGFDI